MAKKDDVFCTTEVFSIVDWKEQKSKNKRVSINVLNNNGCIVFFQNWKTNRNKGQSPWNNKHNFWCPQDDMDVLAEIADMVINDIENGSFSKERCMEGNKSNLYFVTKQSNGKVYIGMKVVPKKKDKETSEKFTVVFPTDNIEGQPKGLIKLKSLRDSIKGFVTRKNSSYDAHYQKYFDEIGASRSSGSSSSSSPDENVKEEDPNDESIPFG